jgi:hypothetical protein
MTCSDANASNLIYGFEMRLHRGGQSIGNALAYIGGVMITCGRVEADTNIFLISTLSAVE